MKDLCRITDEKVSNDPQDAIDDCDECGACNECDDKAEELEAVNIANDNARYELLNDSSFGRDDLMQLLGEADNDTLEDLTALLTNVFNPACENYSDEANHQVRGIFFNKFAKKLLKDVEA